MQPAPYSVTMRRGVTMWDPASTYVDADVELAEDVSLLPGTIVKGACRIGAGAQVGPGALLVDVVVGARARVGTVHATSARIGEDAEVGSFSVLGPGTGIGSAARVKGTSSSLGSRANRLRGCELSGHHPESRARCCW